MNPTMKDIIVEACLRVVKLSSEHKTTEAIAAMHEVSALFALNRRIEETEMWLCVEAIR